MAKDKDKGKAGKDDAVPKSADRHVKFKEGMSRKQARKAIHPKYVDSVITCGCGNVFETRSTRARMTIAVCSKCHPFYTGTQRFLDTAGRVERFQRKYGWVEGKTPAEVAQSRKERLARAKAAAATRIAKARGALRAKEQPTPAASLQKAVKAAERAAAAEPKAKVAPAPAPAPSPEPEAAPVPAEEPEAAVETRSEAEPAPAPTPEVEPAPKAEAEATAGPEPVPVPASVLEAAAEMGTEVRPEPVPEPEVESGAVAEPAPPEKAAAEPEKKGKDVVRKAIRKTTKKVAKKTTKKTVKKAAKKTTTKKVPKKTGVKKATKKSPKKKQS